MTVLWPCRGRLHRCRRASVAIYVALMVPVLAGAVALGVEVSSWAGVQAAMQRTADASAMAAGIYCSNYQTGHPGSTCGNNSAAQQVANSLAQNLATVNGASSSHTSVVSGIRSSLDTAIQVSAQKAVPLTISRIFDSSPSVTVSATSTSEIISQITPGTGGQPCILALNQWNANNTAMTTGNTGFIAAGSLDINAWRCRFSRNVARYA
jgi:Flp pilus assembly protein TadG